MIDDQPLLKLEGVQKRYSGRLRREGILALQDIALEVFEGEFLCVLGESGCGKSTLLHMIAGMEKATAGVMEFEGAPIAGPHHSRGMVFQAPALYPWLTVRRNVQLGLNIRGIKDDGRVDRYLEVVGLQGFEECRPTELSGGMAQRVAIARALVNQPKMLLLDEPFGALDAWTRANLQDELLQIWREEGCTVIFVTHDIDEAIYLGSRIAIMSPRPGRISARVTVPLGRPRLRTGPRVRRFRDEVSRELLDVIRTGHADAANSLLPEPESA